APLKPAQSRTRRFPGAPDGRGTPLPDGDGRPDAAGARRGAGAPAQVLPGDGAARPRPTHPAAARSPASRPGPRRRIAAEISAISVSFAGTDGGDVGRVG